MKSLTILLSVFMLGHVIQAQKSDIEIVQTLISKYHTNIRMELNSIGLTFTQKKQKSDGDVTKYFFFINGNENNTKPWEIYTKSVNDDKVRVVRILIKYYYKNQGDIIELDKFIVPDDQLINGYFVTYEKSEGKKQAHIDININETNLKPDVVNKQTKFTKVLSNSNEKIYFQLLKNFMDTDNNVYFLKVAVMDSFSCVGLRDNYIKFKFFNNETVILNGDGASHHCDFSAVSSFYLNDENIQKLKKNPISIIQFKQGKHEYNIFVANSNVIIDLIGELGIK